MSEYQLEYEDYVARCYRNRIEPLPFREWAKAVHDYDIEWEALTREWSDEQLRGLESVT